MRGKKKPMASIDFDASTTHFRFSVSPTRSAFFSGDPFLHISGRKCSSSICSVNARKGNKALSLSLSHPRAQVARAEDVVDPPRDQQRLEAGGEGSRPVRDVEVADAEHEHHGARREEREPESERKREETRRRREGEGQSKSGEKKKAGVRPPRRHFSFSSTPTSFCRRRPSLGFI